MTDAIQRQLTFKVGGSIPDTAIVRVSGALHLDRELDKGEETHIQIVDADGQVVANGYGRVVQVAFKDKIGESGDVESTERIHIIKAS